ncbi:hypothetical protein XSR1_240029 [Xenorhabdus szentirmaii DSM 16338]|uniref:Uncharacterized protein n=1 Tax=Xenorhabdus szentirmaii DSM 16338 TaxID=1427518 RepID=W1IY67_9GAMM|nr:hypothetical protein XSR1_240029 [Xenorhabdus szentirmaii DSM 16338]
MTPVSPLSSVIKDVQLLASHQIGNSQIDTIPVLAVESLD